LDGLPGEAGYEHYISWSNNSVNNQRNECCRDGGINSEGFKGERGEPGTWGKWKSGQPNSISCVERRNEWYT